jgi:hypothetical protein
MITGDLLYTQLKKLTPSQRLDVEGWVVNSVKLNMISKMDYMLEGEGKINLRRLFLVPLFRISELEKRVNEQAPEIKTIFYKELSKVVEKAEKQFRD